MNKDFLTLFLRRQSCATEIDRLSSTLANQRKQLADIEREIRELLGSKNITRGAIRWNGRDYLVESHRDVTISPLINLAYVANTNGHPHRAVPPEPVIPGDADQCRPDPDPEPVPREALEALDLAGVEGY